MHTHVIDNINQRGYPGYRYNKSFHAWWGMPNPPLICWLRGHRPVFVPVGVYGTAHIKCGRCHARPHLREAIAARLLGGWEPPAHWLDSEVDRRADWSLHRQGEAGCQLVLAKTFRPRFSARFHVGGRGSETPWDAHLDLFGAAAYVNTNLGRNLAESLTRGKGSRDILLRVDRETGRYRRWTVQWKLWAPVDGFGGVRREQTRWQRLRDAYTHPSIADALWGKVGVHTDVRDEKVAAVDLADDLTHLIRFRLEHHTVGRPRQNPRTKERSWWVDWSVETGPGSHGIGMRTERTREGLTWTRGRVFGSSLPLPAAEAGPDWIDHAVRRLRNWTEERRAAENAPDAVHGG